MCSECHCVVVGIGVGVRHCGAVASLAVAKVPSIACVAWVAAGSGSELGWCAFTH